MRKTLGTAAASVLIACIAAHLAAQQVTTSVSGVVQDRSGAVMPGATVRLTQAGRTVAETVTGGDGRFSLPVRPTDIGPDMAVEVAVPGFATARRSVSITVGQSQSLTVALQTGPPPPPPPPATRPVEPVWNVWPQSAGTGEAGIKPQQQLDPQSDFVLVVDLSGIALAQLPGAQSTAVSKTFNELLRKASDTSSVSVQLVLVPDERSFHLRDEAARVQTLKVDLSKMRAFSAPANPTPDDARRLVESRAASFGRVEFPLRTTDRVGAASIAISFWISGSIPVDELSVPLCIQRQNSTGGRCNPRPVRAVGLSGHDSVRVAAGATAAQLPDGALQFIELDREAVVGVFRCNSCGWPVDKFVPWRLKRSLSDLKTSLTGTLDDFGDSGSENRRRSHGQALFLELFDSDTNADQKAARQGFTDFVHARLTSTPGQSPSLFVRLLAKSSSSTFTIPIGLLTLPDVGAGKTEKPIGLLFRVETPLLYQDYTPSTTCLSNWAGLVPDPNQFQDGDEMHRLGGPIAAWVPKFTPTGGKRQVFSDVDAFRRWISDDSSPATGSGFSILVASHHKANAIYLKDGDTVESVFVQRHLPTPSVVIMNACGTGKPDQTDFIRRFNENGASAAIATSTAVSPELGAEFVGTLLGLAGQHKDWSLGELFFQTVVKVSRKYKTEALSYMLLGNAGLRICLP